MALVCLFRIEGNEVYTAFNWYCNCRQEERKQNLYTEREGERGKCIKDTIGRWEKETEIGNGAVFVDWRRTLKGQEQQNKYWGLMFDFDNGFFMRPAFTLPHRSRAVSLLPGSRVC